MRKTRYMLVRSMSKTKLSYHVQLNLVLSMIKTRQDNDMTDRIGLVYAKTKTELLGSSFPFWPIEP